VNPLVSIAQEQGRLAAARATDIVLVMLTGTKCRGFYLAKQNSKYFKLGLRYLTSLKLNSCLEGHVIAALQIADSVAFILGSSLGGVRPVRNLRGGGRGVWCEEWNL